MQPDNDPSPSPLASPNPSTLLRDVSNFRTPQSSFQNPRPSPSPFPAFFTASKKASRSSPPSVAHRRRSSALASRKKAARSLHAFELEQSQSARKAHTRREKSIETLSRSLSAWLNFLFKNPRSCGCDASAWNGVGWPGAKGLLASRKRESVKEGPSVGTEKAWRSPKRQRNCLPQADTMADVVFSAEKAAKRFASLAASIRDACSFEDVVERMGMYLSPETQNEVLTVMSRVAKNIDEGRLKMKSHCPIVTDVGLKEKATKTLMCYNITWLKIGLHIVFGGNSLLPNEDDSSDQDSLLLRMIIEKQFFSQTDLAKSFSYNKLVEGLYRPGYFEALGSIILKRFLLLVLILDRAKCQSSLPLKYGIDGIDGGSPLLFNCQSHVKSSRQVIQEFLSPVMHGEGDLLAHLVIVGYKVLHQQSILSEYDFRVTNLFEDLQDGVRLCRAIQLLQCDSSILMKVAVPSDNRKKKLLNCGIAMQFLKQAMVPLSDEDGVLIAPEDVANGDKELTISLVWNAFIHLQVPLLIDKVLLSKELSKVKVIEVNNYAGGRISHIDMLLQWIQAICKNYNLDVTNFSSLLDGKALCFLVDYYIQSACHATSSNCLDANGDGLFLSKFDANVAANNFIIIQKVATIFGGMPEVLQINDILENHPACNQRSVVMLFVFLSSLLVGRKELDELFIQKLIGWRYFGLATESDMCNQRPATQPSISEQRVCLGTSRQFVTASDPVEVAKELSLLNEDNFFKDSRTAKAARTIQSRFRGFSKRSNYLKMKAAIVVLQALVRVWLKLNKKIATYKGMPPDTIKKQSPEGCKSLFFYERYYNFLNARHTYLRTRNSVILIQKRVRSWINRKHLSNARKALDSVRSTHPVSTTINFQSQIQGKIAGARYATSVSRSQEIEGICKEISAAIKIQSLWRGFCMRKGFIHRKNAIITIQSFFRCGIVQKRVKECEQAAIKVQRTFRGYISRKKLLGTNFLDPKILHVTSLCKARYTVCLQLRILVNSVTKLQRWWRKVRIYKSRISAAVVIQSNIRGWQASRAAYRKKHCILVIQSLVRGWLVRRELLLLRKEVIKIQCIFRSFKQRKEFYKWRLVATEIQRCIRGQISRRKLLGSSSLRSHTHDASSERLKGNYLLSFELEVLLSSIVRIQRWWREVLRDKLVLKSAIIIQSHARRFISRRQIRLVKQRIVLIQSYWRGCHVRKGSREQFLDLRLRMEKTAANIDNRNRLMNRLVSAVSALLSDSVSDILHTCATLDLATQNSQKCCETLVDAGGIDALLKLVRKANRSAPYQEVLKHAFSTLRNLVRYPHLAVVLINANGSMEAIFWELLRNKDECYFVVTALLRQLCSTQKGLQSVCKLPAFLKRLNLLAFDLERKASMEKRSSRMATAEGNAERRWKEAVELLQMVMQVNMQEFPLS